MPSQQRSSGDRIPRNAHAHLARSRPITGLVLVTPFDSLRALARDHYPWLPVGLLLRHRMDLASVSAPVAVIAAANETVVPPHRTAAVRLTARNLIADQTIAAAGRNDIYDRGEFRDAMQTALRRNEAGSETHRRAWQTLARVDNSEPAGAISGRRKPEQKS